MDIKQFNDLWLRVRKHPRTSIISVLVIFIIAIGGWFGMGYFGEKGRQIASSTSNQSTEQGPIIDAQKPTKRATGNQPSETTGNIPPNAHIEQHSEGPNSPNVIGNLTINPPQNPNAVSISYDFNEMKRKIRPGKVEAEVGAETVVFQKLVSLQNSQQWNKLLDESDKTIKKVPEWLTPYAFKGLALAQLDRTKEAIELLEYVDKNSTGNRDFDEARQLLAQLKSLP